MFQHAEDLTVIFFRRKPMISTWPDPVEAKALSGTVDAIIVVLGLDAWQKIQGRLLGHKMRVKPCQVAEIGRVNFHKMLNGQKDAQGKRQV